MTLTRLDQAQLYSLLVSIRLYLVPGIEVVPFGDDDDTEQLPRAKPNKRQMFYLC